MLLDTNVLVAAFYTRDKYHETARYFIDEWEDHFLVPVSVLVETWGMLVGSRKDWNAGLDLLMWLATPGNAMLMPQRTNRFARAHDLIASIRIDCVDAFLADFGHRISEQCDFQPYIRIATLDTADLVSCRAKKGLQITIFDLRSFEVY